MSEVYGQSEKRHQSCLTPHPETPSEQSTRGFAAIAGRLWLLLCLLVAGGIFFDGAIHREANPPASPHPAAMAASADSPTAPIERIRVGQRVLADNPDLDEPDVGQTEVDPRTWRLVRLGAEDRWTDGTLDSIDVETLAPPEWLAAFDVRVGSEAPVPLDLVEMGLPEDLRLTVTAIEPCPPIESGPGRVVLTTVNHLHPQVMELRLQAPSGRTETVRPTASHKFYRESDAAWVATESLSPGDILRGRTGPLTVLTLHGLTGVHRVYNMTVEGEHVYYVSQLAALAHNNCPPGGGGASRYPDSGFDIDVNPGGPGSGVCGYNVNFSSVANSGFLQTTFTEGTGELYIDVVRSVVEQRGLGEAMYRKAIAVVEATGTKVRTLAGHLRNRNLELLESGGLHATPAFKINVKLGFTRIIERPTAQNGYKLVMGKGA